MNRIALKAPAKINLFLRVLGRRPDGYHDIETLFQAIDLSDALIIEKSSRVTELNVPGFPELETEQNLVLKAKKTLEQIIGAKLPVKISLTKNTPISGGLGGGSSNCAACLKGINELYDLGIEERELLKIAASLGADVPFFLIGGAAIGEGIGDRLTPVDLDSDYEIVLVNPGIPVDTGEMYRLVSRNLTLDSPRVKLRVALDGGAGPLDLLGNQFQEMAVEKYPEIRAAVKILEKFAQGRVLMSGSGATVFAAFENSEAPYQSIRELAPDHWMVIRSRPIKTGVEII